MSFMSLGNFRELWLVTFVDGNSVGSMPCAHFIIAWICTLVKRHHTVNVNFGNSIASSNASNSKHEAKGAT